MENFQIRNFEEFKIVQNGKLVEISNFEEVTETLKFVEDQMNKLPKHYNKPEQEDCLDMLISEKKKQPPSKKVASIPTLPQGKTLEFNFLQNWGDQNYIGLCGIEIFDDSGRRMHGEDISQI